MSVETEAPERVYAFEQLAAITGNKSKATLYKWISRGTFPAPVRIGPNSVVWRESDLAKWQAAHFAKQGVKITKSIRRAVKARGRVHAERKRQEARAAKLSGGATSRIEMELNKRKATRGVTK